MSWQITALILGTIVTAAFTFYKLYTSNINPDCASHDKRLSLLEQEMKERNKNGTAFLEQLNEIEKGVHEDIGKVWDGIDRLKDLIIKKLG